MSSTCRHCNSENHDACQFCMQCGQPLQQGEGLVHHGAQTMTMTRSVTGRDGPGESALPVPATPASLTSTTMPSRHSALLIDVSGSMSEAMQGMTRFDAAKNSGVAYVLNRSGSEDCISFLTFDDQPRPQIECEPLATSRKAIAKRIKQAQHHRGGTKFYPALERAWQMVNRTPHLDREIVLITDGHDMSLKSTTRLCESIKADGVRVLTIGIGDSESAVNAQLLRQIASPDRGSVPSYCFLRSAADLTAHTITISMTA